MDGDSVAEGLRRHLWLLLAVVAIALSLLAMHQLSSNHTVAGTNAATDHAAAESVADAGSGAHHLAAGHPHTHQLDGHTHGQQLGVAAADQRMHDGDCPGCAGHQAMALTCLAALILLVVGWVLSRPAAWRGVRLRRLTLPPPAALSWTPGSLSLVELSVSRT
jgi:hypothetical protein